MDNRKKRGTHDRSKINMSEDFEVKYWTKALGVDCEKLQKASVFFERRAGKALQLKWKKSSIAARRPDPPNYASQLSAFAGG
jgi:hypothetical protein